MPCATDASPRAALAARAHRLQAALDHVHAIERLLAPDAEPHLLAPAARLNAALTAARDTAAALARYVEWEDAEPEE